MKQSKNKASSLPSDASILERSFSLCNESIFTIDLQFRRLHTDEPEDDEFIFRKWADFQFFIISLKRLRQSAKIATNVQSIKGLIEVGIKSFDAKLPGLITMRNVGEHIDEYAIDKGHNSKISRTQLQVSSQDGNTYKWLDHEINIDDALKAAEELFIVVRDVFDSYPSASVSSASCAPAKQ